MGKIDIKICCLISQLILGLPHFKPKYWGLCSPTLTLFYYYQEFRLITHLWTSCENFFLHLAMSSASSFVNQYFLVPPFKSSISWNILPQPGTPVSFCVNVSLTFYMFPGWVSSHLQFLESLHCLPYFAT